MVEQRKPTDLPNPADGIADEVLAELRLDRTGFIEETLAILSKENRPLVNLLTYARRRVIRSDDFMDWTLVYYAILSKSARKQGLPMIEVTQSVIDKIGVERHLRADGSRAKGVNPLKFLEDSMDMVGAFAGEDSMKSKELELYWDNFFNFMADSTTPATRIPSIQLGVAVYDFADILRTQHKINNGVQPFPMQN